MNIILHLCKHYKKNYSVLWDERGREKKGFCIYKFSVVYNTRKLVATKYESALLMIVIVIDHNVRMISLLSDPSPP